MSRMFSKLIECVYQYSSLSTLLPQVMVDGAKNILSLNEHLSMYAHTHTHTHTRAHTHMHAHAHMRTHTHKSGVELEAFVMTQG